MTTLETFESFAQSVIDDIRSDMVDNNAVATGRTIRSLRYEATNTRLTIYGGEAFTPTDRLTYVETGRGPTKQSQGGVLYPRILEWVKAKGIRPEGKQTVEQLARAITKKIHQRGTNLWILNRNRDIVQNNITQDRVRALQLKLADVLFFEFSSQVSKIIRNQ
jgi:hypothetical protein